MARDEFKQYAESVGRIRKAIELCDQIQLSFARLLRSADSDPQLAKDAEAVLRAAVRCQKEK